MLYDLIIKVEDGTVVDHPIDVNNWAAVNGYTTVVAADLQFHGYMKFVSKPEPENLPWKQNIKDGYAIVDSSHVIDNWVSSNKESLTDEEIVNSRKKVKSYVAQTRWIYESFGVEVTDGNRIFTLKENLSSLNNVYVALKNGLIASANIKTENEWVTVDADQMESIFQQMVEYVQKCYNVEKTLSDQIDLLTTGNEFDSYLENISETYKSEFFPSE